MTPPSRTGTVVRSGSPVRSAATAHTVKTCPTSVQSGPSPQAVRRSRRSPCPSQTPTCGCISSSPKSSGARC